MSISSPPPPPPPTSPPRTTPTCWAVMGGPTGPCPPALPTPCPHCPSLPSPWPPSSLSQCSLPTQGGGSTSTQGGWRSSTKRGGRSYTVTQTASRELSAPPETPSQDHRANTGTLLDNRAGENWPTSQLWSLPTCLFTRLEILQPGK